MPASAELDTQTEKPRLFLSVSQAAALVHLKEMMLYRYLWAKKGPRFVRYGRLIRIRYDDLMKWAEPGKIHPPMNTKRRKRS